MLNAVRWILGYAAYSTLCLMTIIVIFNGCSTGRGGKDTLCTVQGGPEPHQHTVTCPDGSTSTISDGQRGEEGASVVGSPGAPGTAAQPCVVTAIYASDLPGTPDQWGGALIICPTTAVFVSNGADGKDGTDGEDGLNAALVTMVELCPGATHYSDVFLEVGMCLNNTLYGVYSINDGFLTELPPGNYSSRGLGSSCNLTVGPNCQVTN